MTRSRLLAYLKILQTEESRRLHTLDGLIVLLLYRNVKNVPVLDVRD